MKFILAMLSLALLGLAAATGYFFIEVRKLSDGIEIAQTKLKEANAGLWKKEQELAAIIDENKKRAELENAAKAAKAAEDRLLPTRFGYYGYQISPGTIGADKDPGLVPLQELRTTKVVTGTGPRPYTDAPTVKFKRGVVVRLILYDRMFSMGGPPTQFVNIVAKVKGDEAWVVRNRGYELKFRPHPTNRDIMFLDTFLKPGRYAIRAPNDRFYAFSIEGEVSDPDHCVEEKRTASMVFGAGHEYHVCPGGIP